MESPQNQRQAMKNNLIFATGNLNKLKEVREKLDSIYEIKGLDSIGFEGDIPEDKDTIKLNAIQKAEYIYERFHCNCFAEDTGLEIDSLNGAPGVYSARYAGPQKSDSDNIALVLKNLNGQSNRSARFRTVIAYIENGNVYTFEGILEGQIALEPSGRNGFGYDPIFIPNQYRESFGTLDPQIKAKISHRSKAVDLFVKFLQSRQQQQQQ